MESSRLQWSIVESSGIQWSPEGQNLILQSRAVFPSEDCDVCPAQLSKALMHQSRQMSTQQLSTLDFESKTLPTPNAEGVGIAHAHTVAVDHPLAVVR